jgi:hypothetical protein
MNLRMAWNGRRQATATMHVDRMPAPFPRDFAAVGFKMADQIAPLHELTVRGSRIVSVTPASPSS